MMRVLRWVAVLPGALLGASLARYVIYFGNRLTMDFEGFLAEGFLGLLMGSAFVWALGYTGAWIAPARKTATALALTALAALGRLFAVGLGIFGSIVLIQKEGGYPSIERPMTLAEVLVTPVASIYLLVLSRRGDDVWGCEDKGNVNNAGGRE